MGIDQNGGVEKETAVKVSIGKLLSLFFRRDLSYTFCHEAPCGTLHQKQLNEVNKMTILEVQALTVVRTYLPRIAEELKRIADALENQNSLKRFELVKDGADLSNVEA